MKSFEKKVAVITGAASGIGRALAVGLANRGCDLAIADLDMDGLGETSEMVKAVGVRVIPRRLDVADAEAMKKFAAEVVEYFGKADIIVNNAGIAIIALVEEMNHDAFSRVMAVNFWGVYNGVTAFLPYLRKQANGHIVNISSVFGLWGIPTQAAYNCSKFAVRGLSESLAQELAGTGIIVSCVYPGGIRTNIARRANFHQGFGPMKNKEMFTKLFDKLSITSPEKAAAVIIRGIRARRARILIGPDAYLLDFIQRFFPALYQKIIPTILKWKKFF
ncbi:MAG: short chain dehydrogenase [Desulfobacterales bacterium CG23_combo_of_CG06-09_8_20_14_all_51_8]|nr:MAG: short chain dehydrogenase [Desulfobacterales bacterium CG23_combo_of_CG06-09_8_20_14_all_51_8]